MTPRDTFRHALCVDTQRCVGCAHCIRRCPTKALRIRGGKASLRKDWCVDCGECLKACPVRAIYVAQDDFDTIFDYDCRAVIYPAAFLGQFAESCTEQEIADALTDLGFTHAFAAETTVGIVREQMAAAIASGRNRPLISSLCPAVVRLIQTKFPDLVDHILPIRTPAEATALLVRRRLLAAGHEVRKTGIFYVTPCAAKAASVRDEENGVRLFNGILNLDSLYNRVCRILSGKKQRPAPAPNLPPRLPRPDMEWSVTSGEASSFKGRCLAVDGIDHVKDFLERTEATGELHEVDFLELRACNRGCLGGSLTPVNRFLAGERLRTRLLDYPESVCPDETVDEQERRYLCRNIRTGAIPPMTKLLYKGDIEEVLRSMDAAHRIQRSLPGLDCGACGSPTCESLSHDIVRGEAHPSDCIFMHIASGSEPREGSAMEHLERVWGRKRFRGAR